MAGQQVETFTQQDINAGLVSYFHLASGEKQLNKTSLRLTLQVIILRHILYLNNKISDL